MRTIIRGGRVLDPASSTDGIRDILVEDGIIKEVAEHISTDAENVIEAGGLYVMPGLIDLHVHFREPGFEHKENNPYRSQSSGKRRIYNRLCHAEYQAGCRQRGNGEVCD